MTSRRAGSEREDVSTYGGRWRFGMEEEGGTAPGDGEEHFHGGRHHEGRRNEWHHRGQGLRSGRFSWEEKLVAPCFLDVLDGVIDVVEEAVGRHRQWGQRRRKQADPSQPVVMKCRSR